MALPGELTGFEDIILCVECWTELPLKVLQSPAGYYIGRFCPNCGPYSRETDYYRTYDEALLDLMRDEIPAKARQL